MYRTERQSAWQRDVTWASAVLLALTVMAGVLLFTQAQLASEERGVSVIRSVLELTLRPGGAAADLGVRSGTAYVPGEPLALLPGVEVFADPTEVPTFTVDQAVSRIAGVLADRLITGGAQAMLDSVADPELGAQLRSAVEGPIDSLVRASLEATMLPSGLDDGSRLADWPAQAAANPGELVQPVVGVFVYESPNRLARMSDREIGVAVVSQLADMVMADGIDAARQVITNPNLRTRLVEGADQRARAEVHALLQSLLLGRRGEIEARLTGAAQVLAGEADPGGDALSGLLPASQLAGLSPEEANDAVMDALARRAHQGGGALAAAQLTRQDQAERVRGVAPVIDAFSAAARARYTRWTVGAGVLAAVLLVLVVGFSRGLWRLGNVGLAIVFGSALGAWAFDRLRRTVPDEAALPLGAQAQGLFAAVADGLRFALASVPRAVIEIAWRNHVIALLTGASLLLLAVVVWLLRGVRPRRRSYL
jgi:hypothetical protein